MKHLFIINPAAGSRDRTLECSREIVQLCRDLDYRVEISTGTISSGSSPSPGPFIIWPGCWMRKKPRST